MLTWRKAIWVNSLALLNHILELISRPASKGPSDIGWEASGDVLSCKRASISGRAPYDDVVFAVSECSRHCRFDDALRIIGKPS